MSEQVITSVATSLFAQDVDGGEVVYLGDFDERCFNLDSIDDPLGGIDPIMAQDGLDGIKIIAVKRTGPDLISFTLENLLKPSAFYLEKIKSRRCRFNFYVVLRCGGRAGIFTNWIRYFTVYSCKVTNAPIGNVAQRENADEITQSFEITGIPPRLDGWTIVAGPIPTVETQDLLTVHGFDIENCGDCGAYSEIGTTFAIGAQCDTGVAAANALFSFDRGLTSAASANLPFTASNTVDVNSIRMFQVDGGTVRTIAARSTLAATPLQIAYTDDYGATAWTLVTLGATATEYVVGHHGIWVIDQNHIWVCTASGRVYFSSNAGVSFSEQTGALAASAASVLYSIHFSDNLNGVAVGDSTVIYTRDGGLNWTAATDPSGGNIVTACWAFSKYRWLAVDDTGDVHITWDAGVTWETLVPGFVSHASSIWFTDPLNGYAVDAGASGRIYRTNDGGRNWVEIQGDTADAGFAAVFTPYRNRVIGVGLDDGTTGVIVSAGS